jgi:Mrp family chromosome partitioning ATPase
VLEPETEEEIPFIEVGGKNTPIEASASVRAATGEAKAKRKPSSQPSSQERNASAETAKPGLTITGLSFSPLPAARTTLPPASERFAAGLVTFHEPEHPVSLQYRALAEALRAQLPAREPHALLFAATVAWVDTASVVLNLAISLSQQPETRVVTVDADLHRPAIAAELGIASAPGLADVVSGKVALKRAIQETGHENLFALTAGKFSDDENKPLAGEAMRSVLRHLRNQFNWALVAAPCWDGRPDVVALGAICDAVYLLVPEREADSSATKDLIALISQQGSRLRGCIHLRAA